MAVTSSLAKSLWQRSTSRLANFFLILAVLRLSTFFKVPSALCLSIYLACISASFSLISVIIVIILCFDRTRNFEKTGELLFPENSGPRHGIFNRAHSKFWVVSEWSNEVYYFAVKEDKFQLKETFPLLQREEGAAAAVRLSGDERFLYISLRGADQIAVLAVEGEHLKLVERVSSQGEHPRDFILSSDGQFVLTVNRSRGGLVSMKRDLNSGKIVKITGQTDIPQGVSVILVSLPADDPVFRREWRGNE